MPTEETGSSAEAQRLSRRDHLAALIPHTKDQPIPRSARGEIALTLDLAISTLLYAGGATPRQEDKVTPVRVSAIRGGLRQMWRAAFGHRYKDVESLRQAEALMWGGVALEGTRADRPGEKAARASLVRLKVSFEVKDNAGKTLYEGFRGRPVGPTTDPRFAQGTELGYALFTAREEKGGSGQVAGTALEGVRFRLIVTFPEDNPGVEDLQWQVLHTLRLFLLFGGIGGRTRRGLGALALEAVNLEGDVRYPEAATLPGFWHPPEGARDKELSAFFAGLQMGRTEGAAPPYPQLGGAEVAWRGRGGDAFKIWKGVIGSLKDFRQYRVKKDNPSQKDPYGKSVWPEPSIIKAFDGRGHPTPWYPRGELGLPIVFHFPQRGLPDDHTLVMEGERGSVEDRMASPILLKPVYIGGGTYIGVALRFNVAPPRKTLILQNRGRTVPGSQSPLGAPPPKGQALVPPMGGEDSALDAFMRHFRSGERFVVLGGGAS